MACTYYDVEYIYKLFCLLLASSRAYNVRDHFLCTQPNYYVFVVWHVHLTNTLTHPLHIGAAMEQYKFGFYAWKRLLNRKRSSTMPVAVFVHPFINCAQIENGLRYRAAATAAAATQGIQTKGLLCGHTSAHCRLLPCVCFDSGVCLCVCAFECGRPTIYTIPENNNGRDARDVTIQIGPQASHKRG